MNNLIAIAAYGYSLLVIVASLARFVTKILPSTVPNSDKIGHTIAYIIFVIVWGIYFKTRPSKQVIKTNKNIVVRAFVFGIIFGGLMELAQYLLTSYRQFDLLDILANTLGALIGSLLLVTLLKYFNLNKKSEI